MFYITETLLKKMYFQLVCFEVKVELLLSIDCCRFLLLYKNFNVAHNSKSVKGINTKFGILAHHDKLQMQDKGMNLKIQFWSYAPFLIKNLSRMMAPDRKVFVPHGALVKWTDTWGNFWSNYETME